jgi:hypothetical protein
VAFPTKFSAKRAASIVANVRAGCHLTAAAKAARVHRDTVHAWLKLGEADGAESTHPDHYAWAQEFRAAEGEIECDLVRQIVTDDGIDPQVLKLRMQFLQYRFPQRWLPNWRNANAERALIRAKLTQAEKTDGPSGDIQLVVRCAKGPSDVDR